MIFYGLQFAAILIAFLNAVEESAWSWPFRNETFEDKPELTRIAHRSGFYGTAVWIIGFGIVTNYDAALWVKLLLFSVSTITYGLWYWAVFDPAYGYYIHKSWWYLGTTADTDNWLIKHLGANGGRKKFWYCIIGIIILNALWVAITRLLT